MINTKLAELHTDLGQAMAQAATFERQLESQSQNDYGTLAIIHRTLSETMLRIRHLKDQISELESPTEPEVIVTPINADALVSPIDPDARAAVTKISPDPEITYDSDQKIWKFKRMVNGKHCVIGHAPSHAGIVANKNSHEQTAELFDTKSIGEWIS